MSRPRTSHRKAKRRRAPARPAPTPAPTANPPAWKLRACPFCGGEMAIRQVPGRELFGSECQYEGCRALGPLQHDPFRAVLANNRRGFRSDPVELPPEGEEPARPTLDAAYWQARIDDAEDVCEFRLVSSEHGPGYWASGREALRRKLRAVADSGQVGWSLDIRSLQHGERCHLSLAEAALILIPPPVTTPTQDP